MIFLPVSLRRLPARMLPAPLNLTDVSSPLVSPLVWAPAPHHTLMKNAEAKTRFSAFRGIRIRWAPFSRRVSTRRLSQVLPPVCMPQHVKSQALSLLSLLSLCHPRVKLCFYYSNVHVVGRRCACDSCRFIPNTKDVVYSHHNLA